MSRLMGLELLWVTRMYVRVSVKFFGSPPKEETLHFDFVKGHIGHTETTVGVAGHINVLLVMQHGKIPARAIFASLNPNISSLEDDRMAIPTTTRPWVSSSCLACINSYGATGSNAAIMVHPWPHNAPNAAKPGQGASAKYPLFISTASANSLSAYCPRLLAYVNDLKAEHAPERLLSDLAFNLANRGHHSPPQNTATAVIDFNDLEDNLDTVTSGPSPRRSGIPKKLMPLVLVFVGQESDTIGISKELYQSSAPFRHHLHHCNGVLIGHGLDGIHPAVFQRTPTLNIWPFTLNAFESIPLTLSSNVEGGLMEAIIRYDDRIQMEDLWARMSVLLFLASLWRILINRRPGICGHGGIDLPHTLTQRRSRFRERNYLTCWGADRKGSDNLQKYIQNQLRAFLGPTYLRQKLGKVASWLVCSTARS